MNRRSLTLFAAVLAAVLAVVLTGAATPSAGTLDRVRESGKLRLGHRADARPFSYQDESGKAAGYAIELCGQVVDAVKSELGLARLAVEYVKVDSEDRFDAVEQGQIDLLCGAASVTLARRRKVAFSLPIFPGGISALVREDASERFNAALEGRELPHRPTWRASPADVFEQRVVSAQKGTTAAAWLHKRREQLQLKATIAEVASYEEGVDGVLTKRSDAFFGDRAILLDQAARSPSAGELNVLGPQFTYEPIALVSARGDEDFRLLVDRTLSDVYRSGEVLGIYTRYFGKPDENARTFFRFATLPE